MKRIILLVAILMFYFCDNIFSQELNCTVKINAEQIEGTYKQMFSTLENALNEFINTQKWSQAKFNNVEKIDCTFNFVIKSIPQQDRYSGELTVQARRPVYNAAYTTSVFNFKDNEIQFGYVENEPIVYNEYNIESNLVAIVSYYIYMILGVDFDSFSYKGGEPFFKQAANIVTMCQATSEVGWRAFESNRNRHALVTAFTDEATSSFHKLWYDYHRKGLDVMAQSMDKGRSVVSSTFDILQEVKSANSTSVLLSVFIDTKLDELINIYSKAPMNEKQEIYKKLTGLYPGHTSRLQDIKKEFK